MRALLLPGGVGRSHVQRLILVAGALRSAGLDLHFGGNAWDPDILAAGFPIHHVPDPNVTDFAGNVYASYGTPLIEATVAAERAAIVAVEPDVIVSDFRLTAAISSWAEGVPHVVVTNAGLTRWFDPVEVLIPGGGGRRKAVASRVGRSIQAHQKRSLVARFREVARSLGSRHLESLDDFLDGDAVLIADVPDLLPLRDLPKRARYIGPLVWDGPPGDAPVPPGEQPLVYATSGNTGGPAFVRLVLAAFGEQDYYRVVLTTGPYVDTAGWNPPPWIHVAPFVSGSQVLSIASVAVHCGGTGTTYQTLRAGFPSVVVPFSNEQRINALALKREGAGLPLDVSVVRPEQLRAAVEIIQRPDYLGAAKQLQAEVCRWDAPRLAVDAIRGSWQWPERG